MPSNKQRRTFLDGQSLRCRLTGLPASVAAITSAGQVDTSSERMSMPDILPVLALSKRRTLRCCVFCVMAWVSCGCKVVNAVATFRQREHRQDVRHAHSL